MWHRLIRYCSLNLIDLHKCISHVCITYTEQNLADVFNNVLNKTNQIGWQQLQTIGSGSETLLRNAERYGMYLASALNDTNTPIIVGRKNIGMLLWYSASIAIELFHNYKYYSLSYKCSNGGYY